MPLVAPRPRPRFHPLMVSAVRPLTADAVEVTLRVPDDLVAEFAYVSGQYVTVQAEVGGGRVQRSYSLCAPSRPGELRLGVKRGSPGGFSAWVVGSLSVGDVLEVLPPTGAFVAGHAGGGRYVAVAGGSGITPILAIVRSLLSGDGTARVDLVYANRTQQDVMFADDIAELVVEYGGRFAVHHALSRQDAASPLLTGRLDAPKIRALFESSFPPADVDEWFLCGPAGLIDIVRGELAAAGVPGERIRWESFAGVS